jgi:hypothetical protein
VVDRLNAAIAYYDGFDAESEPHETLVEAIADGWWYSAVLLEGRLAAAFFSDPEILRMDRLMVPDIWKRRLASPTHSQAHWRFALLGSGSVSSLRLAVPRSGSR